MSFDLLVFSPENAPRMKQDFLQWLKVQEELDGPDYDHPDACTAELRGWFIEMIEAFPPMNGPWASEDYDNQCVTDYSVSRFVIYASFAWSQSEAAYAKMYELADKHRVGFFNISSNDEEPLFPNESSISGKSKQRPWWKIW